MDRLLQQLFDTCNSGVTLLERLVVHETELPVVRDQHLRFAQHKTIAGSVVLEVKSTRVAHKQLFTKKMVSTIE